MTGAGLAGLRTVVSLREAGHTGRITLLGAEERPPYDRPPLSKKVLTAGADPSLDADFGALDVDFRPGTTAVSLDPAERAVITDQGPVPYDALVIATGASPIGLPGPGRQRFLRTYDDALALRDTLKPGTRLAIVGAGWIGAELATAAAGAGAEVTVVEAAKTPLAAVFGPEFGAAFASWYAEAGVTLRTGAAVSSVAGGGLVLAGGERLAADEVVTAVGVRPATGWLRDSGLALDGERGNCVAVDSGLRASLPGVWAVGDCASFPSGLFGTRLRVEHWDVALHAPEVAAENILGGSKAYDPVPYFWSEQFGRMVQYVGHHGPDSRMVRRGDPGEAKWSACWVDGSGTLVALLTVGRPKDMVQARRLIAARAAVDAERLSDPAVPVKETALTSNLGAPDCQVRCLDTLGVWHIGDVTQIDVATDQLVGEWLTLPEVAERLEISASRVKQLLRDHKLLAVTRPDGERGVPAVFLDGGQVVKGLSGTLTVLFDCGFGAEEALRWLFTADETLPGTPIDALYAHRGTEVNRRAQALAF